MNKASKLVKYQIAKYQNCKSAVNPTDKMAIELSKNWGLVVWSFVDKQGVYTFHNIVMFLTGGLNILTIYMIYCNSGEYKV